MSKVIDAEAAVGLIHDGDCVVFGGSGGGHGLAESLIEALAERFRASAAPRDLTLISIVSVGDWQTRGFGHLALPGLVKRVISGGYNNCPPMALLVIADEVEAYTLPQGVLSQLCRETAAGRRRRRLRVTARTRSKR